MYRRIRKNFQTNTTISITERPEVITIILEQNEKVLLHKTPDKQTYPRHWSLVYIRCDVADYFGIMTTMKMIRFVLHNWPSIWNLGWWEFRTKNLCFNNINVATAWNRSIFSSFQVVKSPDITKGEITPLSKHNVLIIYTESVGEVLKYLHVSTWRRWVIRFTLWPLLSPERVFPTIYSIGRWMAPSRYGHGGGTRNPVLSRLILC